MLNLLFWKNKERVILIISIMILLLSILSACSNSLPKGAEEVLNERINEYDHELVSFEKAPYPENLWIGYGPFSSGADEAWCIELKSKYDSYFTIVVARKEGYWADHNINGTIFEQIGCPDYNLDYSDNFSW